MTRYAIMTILAVLLAATLHAVWEIDTGAGFAYTDNVFNLSDKDINRFDAGEDYFDWAETTDDFLVNAWLRGRMRAQVGDWRISPMVKGGYDYYASNTDKSTTSLLTGLELDWRKLAVNVYYGYYPDTWLRNYIDVCSATDAIVKFSYDKNMFKLDANYRIFRRDWVYLYGKFEQYYHNEHFTEYDADAVTLGIGWRHSFQTFYFKMFYYFRNYECGDPPPTGAIDADEFSVAGYEADIIEMSFRNKKVEIARNRYIRPFIDFKYEKRGYQTVNAEDKYHAGREDSKYNVTFGTAFYLWPDIELTAEYDHVYRKVSSSVKPDIGTYKDYITNQFSLGISYTFSL
ncbi:MAG: hypothetical protein K8R90_04665 [Candidatus Cloacimonetes bacterium]|nr:hypothetical protein [Candidatus Cloacimonadota bacterium]